MLSRRYSPLPPDDTPILRNKHWDEPSVFVPEDLLREGRRQKGLSRAEVPKICVLDSDGDILRFLQRTRQATRSPTWACYHTDLYGFEHKGMAFGTIACAVGGSLRGRGRALSRYG